MESHDAAGFLFKLWPKIEANKNKIAISAGIIVLAAIWISFFSWQREQNQIAAGDAATQVVITLPPNADPSRLANGYLGVADDYPNTPAGEHSLLQGAAALFAEGKYPDAQAHFQQFLDAHPDGDFSAQAALGVAKCLEAEGKANDAVGEYERVINDFSDPDSKVAAQFALAQIDMQEGHYADAAQLFQQVMQEAPYSAIGNEAAQYAFELRSKTPAPAPAAPAGAIQLSH